VRGIFVCGGLEFCAGYLKNVQVVNFVQRRGGSAKAGRILAGFSDKSLIYQPVG
jgi:hypothetical protein